MGTADVALLTNFAAHKAATLCLSPPLFARGCIPSFCKVRITEHQLWKILSVQECRDNVRCFLFPCLQTPPPGLSDQLNGGDKMGTFIFLFIYMTNCLVLAGKGDGTKSWK